MDQDEISQLDTQAPSTFLTKEEHDNAFLETRETLLDDTNDFGRGYQLTVLDAQRQIILRNRDVLDPKGKERKEENSWKYD